MVHHNQKRSTDGTAGFRLGPWRVDPCAGELRADGRVIRLRPKVMDLLVALAARPGEVCTKTELLDAVWPEVVVTEASLSVAVAELREALGDDPSHPTSIETIPRRGYRLIAPVLDGPRPVPESPSAPYSLIGRSVTIALDHGRIVIGRDPECDVRLDSHHVSRFHAAVEVVGDRVLVEDLGSKNGTFVNDQRLEHRSRLVSGDSIRIGPTTLVYRSLASDPTRTQQGD